MVWIRFGKDQGFRIHFGSTNYQGHFRTHFGATVVYLDITTFFNLSLTNGVQFGLVRFWAQKSWENKAFEEHKRTCLGLVKFGTKILQILVQI